MTPVEPDARTLYQQVIVAHNRAPHNLYAMADATHSAEGSNPLCGDHFTVYVKFDGHRITAVSYTGSGCAIAKASASLMSDALADKTVEEARALHASLEAMMAGSLEDPVNEAQLQDLAALSGVRAYPVRRKCAELPWKTLLEMLHEDTAHGAV